MLLKKQVISVVFCKYLCFPLALCIVVRRFLESFCNFFSFFVRKSKIICLYRGLRARFELYKYAGDVVDLRNPLFFIMNKTTLMAIGALLLGGLTSCHWATMESRLAARVDGSSNEYKILATQCPAGGITEYTTASGKKIYVQQSRVYAESASGALLAFGSVEETHFTVGKGTRAKRMDPIERYVVIGYHDLVYSGITPPEPQYRHPLGEKTMLWRHWEGAVQASADPGMQLVSAKILPVAPGVENDPVAWEVFNDARPEPSAATKYLYAPVVSMVDVPLSILGSVIYLPYYNISQWIGALKD